MTARATAAITAIVCAVAFIGIGGATILSRSASACPIAGGAASFSPIDGRYDAEQRHHARIIVAVGVEHGVPVRGQVIAVATALQESGLRNHAHRGPDNDYDSLGLFQQRPSQGWGTPEQIMSPRYAAEAFYRRLVAVAGWQTMPLTVAAQAVQRSAYPDAYARWEADATTLVRLSSRPSSSASMDLQAWCGGAATWARPVDGPLVSGFRSLARPGHDGVDIAAGKGTPIRAAALGVVIRVVCDAQLLDGTPYSCDVDGHPDHVRGCGWFLEILHPDATVTRYCHLIRRPPDEAGHRVDTGQLIGHVGSSGHSSGPHLHLEVHTGKPATEANAVDPVRFFALHGVDLMNAYRI